MSTWKGKTRGGTFGYLFFIYLIKYLGITAAYIFLSLVVLYFVPFAPKATKSTWFYARHILKYNRIRSLGMLLRNYYRLGQILIDKVAIGNGKVDQYRFEFERYPEFLQLLNSEQGVIMIGAHVGNWEIGVPFFDDYGKKINIVMYDAEHRRIKEILEKNGQDKDFKIIPVNEDNLTHVFRITEALNKKEYVCFQGDRYLNKEKLLTGTLLTESSFPCRSFLAWFANESSGGILLCHERAGQNLPFSFYKDGTSHTNQRKESRDRSARTIYGRFGPNTETPSGTMVQLLLILENHE